MKLRHHAAAVCMLLILLVVSMAPGCWGNTHDPQPDNSGPSREEDKFEPSGDKDKRDAEDKTDGGGGGDDKNAGHQGNDENAEMMMAKVQEIMGRMTLEEKIGQMIIVGFDGLEAPETVREMISTYHAGSVILFTRNIKDRNQLVSLINQLKKANEGSEIPLIISADQEGGRVTRLPDDATQFPSSLTVGKHRSPQLAYDVGMVTGTEMKAYGFNLNFAPVLDIFSNPQNQVIGDRAFGYTPDEVSELGIANMKGLKDGGVIPAIKHFPGHGDTIVDSHTDLPKLSHSLSRLESFELIPFKEAIRQGADMVMVAHIVFPAVMEEELPASLSYDIITGILRDKLGFEGVVISDDMEMGAIEKHFGIEEASLKAVAAGTDIVSVCHTYEKQKKVIHALIQAVREGTISESRINESVRRILLLKLKYGLSDDMVDPDSVALKVGTEEHRKVLEQVLDLP